MAVPLSEKEAAEFIRTWTPKSDVYAFHHGSTILTASSTFSAAFINFRFRRAFKLRNFAFISTYAAAVVMPAFASAFVHGLVVVQPLLSNKVQCPVCLETRGALAQVMCSVAYPIILSPLACIPFADRYMTMAVPSIFHNPMLVLKQVVKILKPIRKTLLLIVAVQLVVGGGLAHWELSNLFTVVEKVQSMEEVLLATVSEEKMKSIRAEASRKDFNDSLKHDKPRGKYFFSRE